MKLQAIWRLVRGSMDANHLVWKSTSWNASTTIGEFAGRTWNPRKVPQFLSKAVETFSVRNLLPRDGRDDRCRCDP